HQYRATPGQPERRHDDHGRDPLEASRLDYHLVVVVEGAGPAYVAVPGESQGGVGEISGRQGEVRTKRGVEHAPFFEPRHLPEPQPDADGSNGKAYEEQGVTAHAGNLLTVAHTQRFRRYAQPGFQVLPM